MSEVLDQAMLCLQEHVEELAEKDAEIARLRANTVDLGAAIERRNAELARLRERCHHNGEEIARLRQQLDGKDEVRRLVEVDLSELARLRRENDDDSPGTPLGRLGVIAVAAAERGLCTGAEAKPAEVFLIEAYDRLRAENVKLVEALKGLVGDGVHEAMFSERISKACAALRSATETKDRADG